jgi:hypothetical protein
MLEVDWSEEKGFIYYNKGWEKPRIVQYHELEIDPWYFNFKKVMQPFIMLLNVLMD